MEYLEERGFTLVERNYWTREDLRAQLTDAIGRHEDREKLVTTFYFYEGLTLKEIGKALSLTEGRVSQILKSALTKLRYLIEEPSSLA